MTTDPGLSVEQSTAVAEWIEGLPEKDTDALLRDQVILLNAIHQSLVQLQRMQVKSMQCLEEIADNQQEEAMVSVNDVNMAFTSMVVFIIKWTLATIPALLILAFAIGLALVILGALGWLPPAFGIR